MLYNLTVGKFFEKWFELSNILSLEMICLYEKNKKGLICLLTAYFLSYGYFAYHIITTSMTLNFAVSSQAYYLINISMLYIACVFSYLLTASINSHIINDNTESWNTRTVFSFLNVHIQLMIILFTIKHIIRVVDDNSIYSFSVSLFLFCTIYSLAVTVLDLSVGRSKLSRVLFFWIPHCQQKHALCLNVAISDLKYLSKNPSYFTVASLHHTLLFKKEVYDAHFGMDMIDYYANTLKTKSNYKKVAFITALVRSQNYDIAGRSLSTIGNISLPKFIDDETKEFIEVNKMPYEKRMAFVLPNYLKCIHKIEEEHRTSSLSYFCSKWNFTPLDIINTNNEVLRPLALRLLKMT
ncbi:hypothetical protein L1267_17940 [Pseudoalteromonas sp. OFAV1]|uniref:hypothetical protein n=1 Tax=Pseudoalteromonas sp. OFAV1 TaxID=2908892 RepID=UPI001F1AC9D4|nr:hypothetical protein [Pseudoalteromonas sp. OFAV1]MCF2902254.1 hypothetical protein [Pseudoalteromonas sp. OFAV1]